jgi:VWFA-related protein
VLFPAQMLAQQPPAAVPPAPAPEAVFSVTTTLVQVDAVVTDSKGHYLTSLTPDDFAIYDDGKPQNITKFSYVRLTSPPAAGTLTEAKPSPKGMSALPPAPGAPTRPEDVRRTIVLMVDDLGLSFETMAYVRSSLRKFVERQMQPGDLVAVCRTGAGSGALQKFTTDKRILLSVIDALHYNLNGRAGINFFEPYGKYSQLAQQLTHCYTGGASGDADSINATYEVGRNTVFTVGTLGAINYIVGALRELPGRKSIVLFSDGLQLFAPGQGPVRHAGMASAQDMESNAEILLALRKLVDRANRSGTVIYTMHTGGLQPVVPDAQDRIDLTGMSGQAANDTLNAITHGVGSSRAEMSRPTPDSRDSPISPWKRAAFHTRTAMISTTGWGACWKIRKAITLLGSSLPATHSMRSTVRAAFTMSPSK